MAAAMAPGSQKWKGTSADLLRAPTSMSNAATVASAPVGGAATMAGRLRVEVRTHRMTMPTSIARPPIVVTMSAVSAAPRLALRVKSLPMSR